MILDELFNNPEEEIIFNYEEIDKDEEKFDNNTNTNNILPEQTVNINDQEYKETHEEITCDSDEEPICIRQPNWKYPDFYQFLITEEVKENSNIKIKKYTPQEAKIILMFVTNSIPQTHENKTGSYHTHIYGLRRGILRYSSKGEEAEYKELSQLHNREVFKPIKLAELTREEKEKTIDSIIFLQKKKSAV